MRINFLYDDLNRLIHASGKAKNASYDMAMTFGLMSEPLTKVQKVDSSRTAKSYDFVYRYEDDNHPTAPTQIGHDHYTYDADGNPILIVNDSTNTERKMYWDEDDRLMVLSDNGRTSRYTYNAAGDRIIKSHGTMEGVYINGAPQGITFHETDDFTLYPASILTVNKGRFTKHYFIGSQRVASRIGTGSFNNVYGRNSSYVTAGQQDYAQRMSDIESQREEYYKQQGIAPGVPTEKGAYGDPENTGIGYNSIITELGDHSVPDGWVQTPKHNDEQGSNPGAPISWNDPTSPDDPQPGYGYIADDTTTVEDTYFFHSDHLGSTSYITDANGNVTQYDAYLPYGELLVDEHSSSEDMPYKFNGKEFDEETGLYYYGARYMDPVASMWYGVDKFKELYVASGSYVYCAGNPICHLEIDGNGWVKTTNSKVIWDDQVNSQKEAIKYYGETGLWLSNNKHIAWLNSANSPNPKRILGHISVNLKRKFQAKMHEFAVSKNLIISSLYGTADDVYTVLQFISLKGLTYSDTEPNPLTGSRYSNLDGSTNLKPIDGFINSITTIMPMMPKLLKNGNKLIPKGIGYVQKWGVAKFSHFAKSQFVLRFLNKTARLRGYGTKLINLGISQWDNFISEGKILLKSKMLNKKDEKE